MATKTLEKKKIQYSQYRQNLTELQERLDMLESGSIEYCKLIKQIKSYKKQFNTRGAGGV